MKRKNPAASGRYFTPDESRNIAAEMLVLSQVTRLTTEEKLYLADVIPDLIEEFRAKARGPKPDDSGPAETPAKPNT
jgi:hypothetical protein